MSSRFQCANPSCSQYQGRPFRATGFDDPSKGNPYCPYCFRDMNRLPANPGQRRETSTGAVRLMPLREALETLAENGADGTPDIIAACIMAGGVPVEQVPTYTQPRWSTLEENSDAQLALHALANADTKATLRWKDHRQFPDGLESMPDTWCEMLASLINRQELDEWIAVADQHLDIARIAKYEILPALAEEFRREKLLAMAVAQSEERYHTKYGEHPGGRFGLTILEVCTQFNG